MASLTEAALAAVLGAAGLGHLEFTHLTGAAPEHGVTATSERVRVRSAVDEFNPGLRIIWEHELELPVFRLPDSARVFTRERWTGTPLAAGWTRNGKPFLWTAAPLGPQGYERYPYLVQALGALGAKPLVEARHLWAFFDSSYRLRADPDYLAKRWRAGGIAALHVAAWQYWEPDPLRDQFLQRLIEACHRNAILVYAWIEFPHVSEQFWRDHPQWREQTATLQDAHLDWRKLMNLLDPDCAAAVARGLEALAARFDWDGFNLGELYFESLEGADSPARFTPFNSTVRAMFQQLHGADPVTLFTPEGAAQLEAFLDFRAGLAHRLQVEWLERLAALRADRPHLDLVLTHIDDRFDTTMREKLGADAARLLPDAERLGVTFLIEDPATVWHLGPARYAEIAERYAPLTRQPGLLAIDLNIVERYQDVYPAKQQTGVELFQLVHRAAASFPRVALYFENSIAAADWPWLAAAAAAPARLETGEGWAEVESARPLSLRWAGCARVNGRHWAAGGENSVLLPAGRSRIEACDGPAARVLKDFNGLLHGVETAGGRITVEYESVTRAIAVTDTGYQLLPPGRRRVELR